MNGLVLATHGNLGEALIRSMEVILGEQPQVEALSLQVEDDIEAASKGLREAVAKVDSGDGVLILTDMLGGTPSNLALSLLGQPQIEVISGVNLPMLLKAAQALLSVGSRPRDESLDPAEHAALTAVCLAILNLDESLTRE